VRGLNHPSKQIEVRRIVKEKKIKLVCLIETRVKDHKAGAIVASLFPDWGFCFNYENIFWAEFGCAGIRWRWIFLLLIRVINVLVAVFIL
jgi:hypothetical protein